MPYLFVGAGQAGSAIVDDVFDHTNMERIATPLVFNSTIRDLRNLSNIGSDSWYGIAEGHGLVEGGTAGFEEQVTGGFGRNPVEANDVMADIVDDGQVQHVFETRFGAAGDDGEHGPTEIPYAFVFVGLGGGTGCGIAPHLVREIRSYTRDRTRVIAVCILPNTEGPVSDRHADSDTEASPTRQAWNTRYGLEKLETEVDGIVFADNQRLSYHVAAEGQFSEFNEYIASSFVDLVSGPALEQIDPGEYEDIDTPIIDLRDIVTSLSFGIGSGNTTTGYAALGRSVTMTRSLAGYLLPFVGRKPIDSMALTQLADSKLSVADIDPQDAEKAIGLIRAPPKRIRDPDAGIETSIFRRYLQSKCDEVNLGMTLTKRNLASFSMLLTFERDRIDRLTEIEDLAETYEQSRGGFVR